MANSSLNITSLDFDTLKSSLKDYLKYQSVFKDYDFEGSNMNVLLSLLSYNSYLNSFYLNMAAAESFMDTAQIRDSVVSHAKTLNYIPSSYKSPEAVLDITFSTTGIGSGVFVIPKGTQFSGTNSNGSFVYVTDRTHTLNSGNGTFFADSIKIYEGSYVTETFVKNTSIENQKFILSNENIDTDSITVTVYENNSITGIDYQLAESLYGVTDASTVYFLQAFKDQYEIVFGDGVFGKTPINGATISVSYRTTKGTLGGGVNTFILDNNLGSYNGGQAISRIVTTTVASAGANAETIESIRFRAPRAYQTQNRAITTEDYKTLILNAFPEIKTLGVYGGETNLAFGVNYGKVIISPITYSGAILSDIRKNELTTFIQDKMSIGLSPIIIDPNILYVVPKVNVKYDPKKTNSTPNYIKQLVTTAIQNYNNTYLKNFDISFIKSDFTDYIMQVDPGITSVNVDNYMKIVLAQELNKIVSSTILFNNQIIPTNINSSTFLSVDGIEYKFTDYNPNVTVLTTQKNNSGISVISSSNNKLYLSSQQTFTQSYLEIGTIDYETGTIYIYDLAIADYISGAGIEIFSVPFNNDISAVKNQVLEIDTALTEITVSNI